MAPSGAQIFQECCAGLCAVRVGFLLWARCGIPKGFNSTSVTYYTLSQ